MKYISLIDANRYCETVLLLLWVLPIMFLLQLVLRNIAKYDK